MLAWMVKCDWSRGEEGRLQGPFTPALQVLLLSIFVLPQVP